VVAWALAAHVLHRAFATPKQNVPTPPLEFVRIGPDVASPLEDLGGLSPRAHGEQKLIGTKVQHFGAFAQSGAREDDWLWGRLDAAAHLTRLLLHRDPHRSRGLHRDEDVTAWIRRAQRAVLEDEAKRRAEDHPADARMSAEELAASLVRRSNDAAGGRDLISAFFATRQGQHTASLLAGAATRLVTRGRMTTSQGASNQLVIQRWLEALIDPDAKGGGLARFLTGGARKALWRTIKRAPHRLRQTWDRVDRLVLRRGGIIVVGFAIGCVLLGTGGTLLVTEVIIPWFERTFP
jgi:hypothetical protein